MRMESAAQSLLLLCVIPACDPGLCLALSEILRDRTEEQKI